MNTSHSEGCREGMLFLLLTVTVLLLLLYIRHTVPKITKKPRDGTNPKNRRVQDSMFHLLE